MARSSVAARVAGWGRYPRNRPGPLLGASTTGVPLLPGVLPDGSRVTVEWAPGADLTADPSGWPWADITADVMYASSLSMSVGRPDETSQAPAASCSLTLLNDGKKYTPWNANSSNWPNVKRNTPLRVSVDLGTGPTVVWQGYIASYAPRWDTTASLAVCDIGAAGSIQRLSQGKTPLRSPLYRAMSKLSGLFAHWPMEDASGSTQFASAVVGVSPLRQGVGSATVTFADAGPDGSLPLPSIVTTGTTSAAYSASVAGPAVAAGQGFCVSVVARVDDTTKQPVLCQFITSGGNTFQFQYASAAVFGAGLGGMMVTLVNAANPLGIATLTGNDVATDGLFHLYQINLMQVGADIYYRLSTDGNLHDGSLNLYVSGTTLGSLTSMQVGNSPTEFTSPAGYSCHVGYISACSITDGSQTPNGSDITSAIDGYTGETASARVTRLCGEQDVAVTVTGSSTTTMGPQPVAAFVDILRECETTDGGLLYDGRGPGLGYICRQSRYNLTAALTVDAAAGELAGTPTPVDDDQRNRNDVTVSRTNGSSAQYIDSTGTQGTGEIGTYDTSVQVNEDTDGNLDKRAQWEVHLGTVEGLRWPNFTLDLAAVPSKAQGWLGAGDLSFRVDLANLDSVAAEAPPGDIRLIVEGWAMTLDTRNWSVVANASPFDPWVVGVLEDATNPWRLDADASTIATDAPAGAASLSVATASGPLWTTTATYPTDFPFDVIDTATGEAMTVTAIVGASSPQTFTVTRAINGVSKPVYANDPIVLYRPPVLAL